MEQKQIEKIKTRINDKIEKGDFKILSKILDVPRNTAVSRFKRDNKEALLIIEEIVINREKFIVKTRKKYEVDICNT